jgi:hypothetical protein
MLAMIQGKENTDTLLVGMQISIATMENSMEAPQKKTKKKNQLKIELPFDLKIPLVGICLNVYCLVRHYSQ